MGLLFLFLLCQNQTNQKNKRIQVKANQQTGRVESMKSIKGGNADDQKILMYCNPFLDKLGLCFD